MKNDDSVLVHSWQSIPEFRSLVRWAAQSSAAALQIFAGFALSGCDDAAAQSLLRQLLITQDLPSRAKIEIILLARIHGITVGGALGNYFSHLISRSGASDQERALCVGDRKLIAGVREYLEDEYQLSEGSLPAFLWLSYRRNPETKSDLVPSMEAAMGALSYYCLKAREHFRIRREAASADRRLKAKDESLYPALRSGAKCSKRTESKDEDIQILTRNSSNTLRTWMALHPASRRIRSKHIITK